MLKCVHVARVREVIVVDLCSLFNGDEPEVVDTVGLCSVTTDTLTHSQTSSSKSLSDVITAADNMKQRGLLF